MTSEWKLGKLSKEPHVIFEERAQIAVVCGDISIPGVAERLVTAGEETGLTLRGVVHSAAVIDDQIVAALSKESMERVWAPKAAGALQVHLATAGRELDWWVGFSSTSSLLGSPGQAAYACASAWLDALVEWRRASGLPATTINWGQWSDIGVARSLTFSALDPIGPAEGIEALEAVLACDLAGGCRTVAPGSRGGRIPRDPGSRILRNPCRGTGRG